MVHAEFVVECDDCGAEDRESMSSGHEGWDHSDEAIRLRGWHHVAVNQKGRKRLKAVHLCPACFLKRHAQHDV